MKIEVTTIPPATQFRPFRLTIDVMNHEEATVLIGMANTPFHSILSCAKQVTTSPVSARAEMAHVHDVVHILFHAVGKATEQALK